MYRSWKPTNYKYVSPQKRRNTVHSSSVFLGLNPIFAKYNQISFLCCACNEATSVMLGTVFVFGCLLVLIFASIYYVFQYVLKRMGAKKYSFAGVRMICDVYTENQLISAEMRKNGCRAVFLTKWYYCNLYVLSKIHLL